jgi:hypothetical protein
MKKAKMAKQAKGVQPVIREITREKVSLATVALFLLIIGALAAAAYVRNSIYRSHVALWSDVTTRSPS